MYWFVRSTDNRGTNKGWAYCHVEVPCLPQACPVSTWKVYDGSVFETIAAMRTQLLSAPPQHMQAIADALSSGMRNEVIRKV